MPKHFYKTFLSLLKTNFIQISIFVAVFVFSLLFVFWYVGQEKTIYYWDYSNYSSLFQDMGRRSSENLLKAIRWIITTIRHYEYNYLSVFFLMPFYFLFGSGRLSFISAVAVTYAFPAIILFTVLVRKILMLGYVDNQTEVTQSNADNREDIIGFTLIPVIFLTFLPSFWIPVMLGYVDVVGVGVIFIILLLYFRKTLIEQTLKELILLGLLLSFLIVLRRWYAFWTVGFFVAATVQEMLRCFWYRNNFANLITALRNIFIIGLTAVLSFFAVATPIAIKMLTTDYSDVYSAYQMPNIFYHLVKMVFYDFGLLLFLICFFGAITFFINKKLRLHGVFLSVLFVTTFYLFTRTQQISSQHFYWIISILAVFGVVFLYDIYNRIKRVSLKVFFISILTIFCLVNLMVVFVPNADFFRGVTAKGMFPHIRNYPKVRTDLDEVRSLLIALDDLTRNSNKNIYVFSNSETLNVTTVKNACSYFEPKFSGLDEKIMANSSFVDRHDGFPFQMLTADYLVVTMPVDYLFAPQEQRAVGFLSEQIVYQKNIGKAFEKMDYDFVLEDGRHVYIYQKKRKFTEAELREISDIFVGFYPNHKEKFEIKPELIRELTQN